MRETLKKCERIVIKAGTSILTGKKGLISDKNLGRLGNEILKLIKQKKQVVLVSSGAIAFGMEAAGRQDRPKEMPQLQACAAIGQGKMMHAYEQVFSKKKIHTAQLLLTRDGMEARPRFLAARHTLEELFKMKALPIANENDTVATEEIAFGDNDILSVHVSHLVEAGLLIILSDVDGFYLRDGSRLREVPSAQKIDTELVRHLRDKRTEKTEAGKAIAEAGKKLDARMTPIEEDLIQVKSRSSQDPLNYPIKLNNRLAALAGVVESADAAPTRQSYEVFDMLSRMAGEQLGKWKQVLSTDVPAFNDLVRQQNVPAISVPPAPAANPL